MAYAVLLFVHIFGAITTGLAGVFVCIALLQRWDAPYRTLAAGLGLLAAFEVATGTALAFVSARVSVASVCDNIALYLLIVLVIEYAIFRSMRAASQSFPTVETISPIGASLIALCAALALGF